MTGRTIKIFLADGTPNGILTAEIINWTGIILVAPRSQLAELAKRDDVRKTGVYCLVGPDPDVNLRDAVYFGEGDNVLKRLTAHDKDESKEFWTHCVVVISKDQNITKSHGRYLESRLVSLGQLAGRATICNGTAPPLPPLPDTDVADMEYFLEQMQLVLPVLGFHFLQDRPKAVPNPDPTQSPVFILTVAGAEAKAQEIDGEFIVMKGSTARKEGLKSWKSYKGLRDQLLEEGKLIASANPDLYVFTEDVSFSSPSAGAVVVNAGNMNGRTSWKVAETGETYQQWHEKKLAATGISNNDSGDADE